MCALDVEVSQSDGTRNERLNWLKLVSTELAAAKKAAGGHEDIRSVFSRDGPGIE